MAWIRVESSVSRNRKFVKAGPAASWLWVCGLAYCQEGLTDGFIPSEALDFLGVKHARRLSLQLVLADLWDVAEGGWFVHDYLGHNKPASEVRRIQDERRTAGAQGGKASGESRRSEANVKQPAEATAKQPANPAVPEISKAEQSRATEPARARSGPGVGLLKANGNVPFEGPRVYVPWKQHFKLLRLRNTPNAEAELQAFYGRVSEEWATGRHAEDSPGADMFAFWQARYDEEWPPMAVADRKSKLPKWAQS